MRSALQNKSNRSLSNPTVRRIAVLISPKIRCLTFGAWHGETASHRTRACILSLCVIGSATTACQPADANGPSFALTSAHVVHRDDASYSANLVFLANKGDPIWTELTRVSLPDGTDIMPGDDVVHTSDHLFTVNEGESFFRDRLGTLIISLPASPDLLSFDTVDLFYADSSDPVTVSVGDWNIRSAPTDLFPDESYEVVSIPGCPTETGMSVPRAAKELISVTTESTAVDVDAASLDPADSRVSFRVTCTDDADLHVFSPTVEYADEQGEHHSIQLAPILSGFVTVDDDLVKRLRSQ